ncbi:hypothetical protein LOTGIDRAFT_225566 [Lottia gigantea]|uniref:Sulfatase N-terminal domain-containing protein n=1 Tax=Lottia gigantea TaxID=225164 RepID=V4B4P1_LOTGI|nr:hypothetical protein LOTGIDRAFT_225566 [Lottia gigantea]ESP00927.1 hypothetical protein LOTGIDRAFT_225566 [Lottia gigantea]
MDVLLFTCVICALFGGYVNAKSPHIVFIVGDDLGWNDVGWHNPAMKTPNLDKLAQNGVILNSSYVQPLCTPSRTAFLSGYYPYRTGLQHLVILPYSPAYLRLNYTLLPQRLKEVGYKTHMVGKWHLGFCNWNYTPTYRGFDSFYGYYNGAEDYYSHELLYGLDLRFNKTAVRDQKNIYSAMSFTKRAEDIIKAHDKKDPLFLYLPYQTVHAPLEVPKRFEEMYSHIQDKNRRLYSGMVSALDEGVGNVTRALQENGFMNEDILIVFTADNGGLPAQGGNNAPLRGTKGSIWEGGTKGAAFVYSPSLLKKTKYVNTGMMHATDWFATFLEVAGAKPESGIDGISQWSMLKSDQPSKRSEFIYNIDEKIPNAGIRSGDFKLLEGNPGDGKWYPVPTVEADRNTSLYYLPLKQSQYRLFNIADDPTEHVDLADKHPDIVAKLKTKLAEYKKSLVPAFNPGFVFKSLPIFYDGTWSPGWC